MEVEVPEDHANILRTLCGLDEHGELPERVKKKYWDLKRLCDRIRDTMSPADLKHLAFGLGYGKPLEREANPTVVDLYRQGKLNRETPVEVQWRNGWQAAVLKRVNGQGRVIVQMDGDPAERPFEVEKVRVAELAKV